MVDLLQLGLMLFAGLRLGHLDDLLLHAAQPSNNTIPPVPPRQSQLMLQQLPIITLATCRALDLGTAEDHLPKSDMTHKLPDAVLHVPQSGHAGDVAGAPSDRSLWLAAGVIVPSCGAGLLSFVQCFSTMCLRRLHHLRKRCRQSRQVGIPSRPCLCLQNSGPCSASLVRLCC